MLDESSENLIEIHKRFRQGEREFRDIKIHANQEGDVVLAEAKFSRCHFTGSVSRLQAYSATFDECVFSEMTFGDVNLMHAKFRKCKFIQCVLRYTKMDNSLFENCEFDKCNLDGVYLQRILLYAVVMRRCTLKGVHLSPHSVSEFRLHTTSLEYSEISNISAEAWTLGDEVAPSRATFRNCGFKSESLKARQLTSSQFYDCELAEANLSSTDLRDTKFELCNLRSSNLLGVMVNSGTGFERCEVMGSAIERHTLESPDNYGNLTKGQRMTLNIIDGSLILRQSYTGFWQWIHIAALVVFLSPYLMLLLRDGLRSQRSCPVETQCESMFSRLIQSIYTGGAMNGSVSVVALLLFSFLLAYNVLRALLLYKAKSLELQEVASGLPVIFPWQGRWKMLYRVAEIGFWLNVSLAILHAAMFLNRAVVLVS